MPIRAIKIGFFLLFMGRSVQAAIAFDSASSASGFPPAATLTWAHTTAGSSRELFVGSNTHGQTVTGITYNSVALTKITSIIVGLTDEQSIWHLIAPATGANNIVVSYTGSTVGEAGAISLTGVDQTVPVEAFNCSSGTASSVSLSITTVGDNSWILDSVGNAGTTLAVGGSQVERWNVVSPGGRSAGSTLGPITPAGAQTMAWTEGVAIAWGQCAASFAAGVTVVSTNDPNMLLMMGTN